MKADSNLKCGMFGMKYEIVITFQLEEVEFQFITVNYTIRGTILYK